MPRTAIRFASEFLFDFVGIHTDETFELDGKIIQNPLRSFVLPISIVDQVEGDTVIYSKPAGYETVRYPLSGLVGTMSDQEATQKHNAQFPNYKDNVRYLNDNISTWLSGKIKIDGIWVGEIFSKFVQCLDAPNYTLFSNTTSTAAWNKANKTKIVPLESPHNYVHLAVGGFDYPGQQRDSAIPGANGDMGENDTAGLDPIFFFHHCFIDYVFWIWQRRHNAIDAFYIEAGDPGANSNANPPPAGIEPNTALDLDTPLHPFQKGDGQDIYTTRDCINIETQLGYTYGPGALDKYATQTAKMAISENKVVEPGRTLRISGIDRSKIHGSFLISSFSNSDGKREYIGTEPILSRWHVSGCMNCLNHLEATAIFHLPLKKDGTKMSHDEIEVEVLTREGLLGQQAHSSKTLVLLSNVQPFKIEIY